ncbi:NEDD8-activating enzyme E1 regulatory subunit, partial [Cladochytrium tenue]
MQAPSKADKNVKYDRQLRLWHAHGQQALEEANICLIHATATGTEILKNLVLPGIGSFTILDESNLSGADAGNNFFLDSSKIGSSRGAVATEQLLELNEEVSGKAIEQSLEDVLRKDPTFFRGFTLVIATAVEEQALLQLANVCWDAKVPLVVVKSYGFFGYMRLAVPEHTVVEPHPDQSLDLRLDRPFPELEQYAAMFDIEKLSGYEYAH